MEDMSQGRREFTPCPFGGGIGERLIAGLHVTVRARQNMAIRDPDLSDA
jgi:hypothetical protein